MRERRDIDVKIRWMRRKKEKKSERHRPIKCCRGTVQLKDGEGMSQLLAPPCLVFQKHSNSSWRDSFEYPGSLARQLSSKIEVNGRLEVVEADVCRAEFASKFSGEAVWECASSRPVSRI